jgi:hypothetical protein
MAGPFQRRIRPAGACRSARGGIRSHRATLCRSSASSCGQGKACHLSLHARRSIACRSLRPEAAAAPGQRQASAFRDAQTRACEAREHLRLSVEVFPARPVRHAGKRTPARDRGVHRRHLRHPLDGRRQHQPQRRGPPDVHRRAGLLAAEPWVVAHVWPRHGESKPARLRRRQSRRRVPGRPALVFQLSPRRVSGHAHPRFEKSHRQPRRSLRLARPAAGEARRAATAQRHPQTRASHRQRAERTHRFL